MADSSPYAIRAGLLELAKNVLSERVHMAFEAARVKNELGVGQSWKPYTTEDIVAEAEKLYAFVSKK